MLGGFGYPFTAGQRLSVRFDADAISLERYDTNGTIVKVFYPEVVDLSITGPGTVTKGGGFIGGGFGFEGALKGMAVAAVLNVLTTRTKIHTFIQLVTHQGEVFLHYGGLEPGALRIALSPVFVYLRRFDPAWRDARLQRLEALRAQGLLSEAELLRLRAPPLSQPTPTGLEERSTETFRNALEGVFAEAERLGVSFVTIRASDFYRRASGDPGDDARMAVCLEVMKASVTSDDVVLNEPTAGESATLTIEYRLPRRGAVRGG